MKRRGMSRGKSKRSFTKGASRTHKFNMPRSMPMRGGIRM